MSFIKEKIAQQKLIKVLNTFKSVIECQDKQIKDLYDRIYKLEGIFDTLKKNENILDSKDNKDVSDSY